MKESTDVRDAWVRFCEGVSAGKIDMFDDIVSEQANLFFGTAPGENITERSAMRWGFEAEGVTLDPSDTEGYEEGSLGWVVDEPRFSFPDGRGVDLRVTAVLQKESGLWKVVHAHFSVGVPDEEVVELQERWSQLA